MGCQCKQSDCDDWLCKEKGGKNENDDDSNSKLKFFENHPYFLFGIVTVCLSRIYTLHLFSQNGTVCNDFDGS